MRCAGLRKFSDRLALGFGIPNAWRHGTGSVNRARSRGGLPVPLISIKNEVECPFGVAVQDLECLALGVAIDSAEKLKVPWRHSVLTGRYLQLSWFWIFDPTSIPWSFHPRFIG